MAAKDREDLHDFMQQTHTGLVCAFFLLFGVHISTLRISAAVRQYRNDSADRVRASSLLWDPPRLAADPGPVPSRA